MNISHLPVLSFIRRYWWVLLLFCLAFLGTRSDSLFAIFDVLIYLPLAFAAWVALPLLWRNLLNADTTDAYIDSGEHNKDFHALPPIEKIKHTREQMGSYLIGSAIIVHALLSNLFPG